MFSVNEGCFQRLEIGPALVVSIGHRQTRETLDRWMTSLQIACRGLVFSSSHSKSTAGLSVIGVPLAATSRFVEGPSISDWEFFRSEGPTFEGVFLAIRSIFGFHCDWVNEEDSTDVCWARL